MLRLTTCGVFVLTCLALAGCGKTDAPNPEPAPEPASGNALYDQHCLKCHTISGSAGGQKKKGPDLSKAGEDPTHTADWIAEHIRNPKAHQPKSSMPPFDQKLSPAEIKSLAEFLAAKR